MIVDINESQVFGEIGVLSVTRHTERLQV